MSGYAADSDPANNVVLMLGKRRRRWANINPPFVQRILFAGEKTGYMAQNV